MKSAYMFGLMIVLFSLTGCSGGQNSIADSQSIPVAVLLNSTQSPLPGAAGGAVWIADPQKLNRTVAEKIRTANPVAAQWRDEDGVLIIQMGRQPSGGYRLSLASTTAPVNQGVAIVSVDWHRPEVGAVVPQVISSPCLILKIPRKGLKAIDVMDQEGHLRARAVVKD